MRIFLTKRVERCVYGTCIVLAMVGTAMCQTVSYFDTGEEFVGPFPSWKNVKTDYGATGNGTTDDAPAIQSALNALKNTSTNTWNVLYFPAGTYKIGSKLTTVRSGDADYQGIQIIGAHPDSTILSWAGASNGDMFSLSAWFCKVTRFTFDGKGTANAGLVRASPFSTYCELSDLVFKGVKTGIKLCEGADGQAEHIIRRCKFTACTNEGVLVCNQNSLDIWIWYCLFEDCKMGVNMGGGDFNVYESIFLRSTTADVGYSNVGVHFTLKNNISFGSYRFLDVVGHSWPGPILIQGNKIYDHTVTGTNGYALGLRPGPCLVIDNVFRPQVTTTQQFAILADGANDVLVGNTYGSPTTPVKKASYTILKEIDANIVAASSIPDPVLRLPATPKNMHRTIFEVTSAADIQAKIISAASLPNGSKAVVHIPKGTYNLTSTVIVPRRSDLQIIGDGTNYGSILNWTATGAGPVMRLMGPSRATLRDFQVAGRTVASSIRIDSCDDVGGRIYLDQFQSNGMQPSDRVTVGAYVNGVERSDVTFIGYQSMYTDTGIVARGGPVLKAGGTTSGQVSMFTGVQVITKYMFNVTDNGRLLAESFWTEGDVGGEHPYQVLKGKGILTMASLLMAHTAFVNTPLFDIDGFEGAFTVLCMQGNNFNSPAQTMWWRIKNVNQNCNVLNMCNAMLMLAGTTPNAAYVFRDSTTSANAAMVACQIWGEVNYNLANVSNRVASTDPSDAYIKQSLAQIRAARIEPPMNRTDTTVTDVKIYRVASSSNKIGLELRAGVVSGQGAIRQGEGGMMGGAHVIMTRKILSMNSRIVLANDVKAVVAYDIHGRIVFNQRITNQMQKDILENRLNETCKSGVVVVKTLY